MTSTIALHELRGLLRDRTLLAAYVVFLGALGVAMATGTAYLERGRRAQAAVEQAHEQHLARMRAQLEAVAAGRTPEGFFVADRPTSVRFTIARPVSPLTPLSIGHTELMPVSASVSLTSGEGAMFDMAGIENPDHMHVGRFDLGFVVVSLLPLLGIALCYGIVSAERERGTLALLLTQPLSIGRVVLVKAVVAWAVLVAPAVLVPVAWTVAVSPEAVASWPALLMYAALVAAYVAFWVALAIAVNLGGLGSAANAAILGGLWLLLVVLWPGLLGILTGRLYPVPSRLALISEARINEVEASRQRDALVDRFFQDHPELLPEAGPGQTDRWLGLYVAALEAQRAVEPVYERFEEQLAAQQRFVALTQFLSPAVVMREALMAIAGTSRRSFSEFRRAVLAHRDQLRDFLEPRVARAQPMTWRDYEAAPRFEFRPARPPWAWQAALGIFGPALLLGEWARRRCRKLENPLTA